MNKVLPFKQTVRILWPILLSLSLLIGLSLVLSHNLTVAQQAPQSVPQPAPQVAAASLTSPAPLLPILASDPAPAATLQPSRMPDAPPLEALQAMAAGRALSDLAGVGASERAVAATKMDAAVVNVASRAAVIPGGFFLANRLQNPDSLVVDLSNGYIWGFIAPGDVLTVINADGAYGADVADQVGFAMTRLWGTDGFWPDFNPGQVFTLSVNGAVVNVVTLPEISGGLDVLADTVSGVISNTSGATVTVTLGAWGQTPASGAPWTATSTAGDGSFTVAFDDVDLGAEHFALLDIALDGAIVRWSVRPDPPVFLVRQYNTIAGYTGWGQPVQATVYSTYPGDVRWQGQTEGSWSAYGYYAFENVEMQTGDVVEVDLGGGTVLSTTLIELGNLSFDVGLEQVYGGAPAGATVRASMWQQQANQWVYTQTLATAVAGDQFTATFAADLRPRDDVEIAVADANGNQIQLTSGPPYVIALQDPHSNMDCVYGRVDGPGLPFTVSLATGSETYVRTGGLSDAGNQTVYCLLIRAQDWSWGPINFTPSNTATLESPSWRGDVVVADIGWEADTAANQILGNAPAGDVVIVVWQWNDNMYPAHGAAAQLTTAASPFTADFTGFDIRDGNRLLLFHYDPLSGYANEFNAWGELYLPYFEAQLLSSVVSGVTANPHEGVTARLYDAGHNLLASVSRDDDGDPWRFWLDFSSQQPLEAGQWLTVTGDSGWTAGMQLPVLEVAGDMATDMVTGQGPLDLLYLEGGGQHSGFAIHHSGPEFVFDTTAFGHDLNWGDVLAVTYEAPSGNRVRREIRLPAPEVGVWKWNPPGHARPGGVINYGVWYQNDGTRVATDTVIVDTLPLSTTYAGDNSGFTPEIGANGVITWRMGDLPPGQGYLFIVTLNVGADVPEGDGALEENCIAISTTAPGDYNPDNDSSCAGRVSVWNDEVEMHVDKWPNPGDPTPGQEFVYDIQVCNNRGAAAGPILLTDTLPSYVSVVNWYNDRPWAVGWQDVAAPAGVFALQTAGFPGGFCDTLHLRLLLDAAAPQNTTLSNYVLLEVADDVHLDNNERLNEDAYTKPPRYDLNTDKWFSSGVLVPGGWVRYGINHWNGGNMPMPDVWITDTLPTGTSYQPGSAQRHNGESLPPDEVTAETVSWNRGELAVADGFGFDFNVDIADSVAPGTVLTNCVAISGAEPEDDLNKNTACITMQVFAHGPNLRVIKEHWWNGDGQLGYRIQFYNLGDEAVNDVWITDTLPLLTTWDGWWNLNFDWNRLVEQALNSDVLAWHFSTLYPGDNGNIEFNANLDEPDARPRWYTNTVEITMPSGDTNPNDNIYTDVAVKVEVDYVELMIDPTGGTGGMWGTAVSGWVTVTTPYTTVVTWADPGNNPPWGVGPEIGPIDAGDTIVVKAGGGLLPVTIHIPDPFTAEVSSSADMVFGQIAGWANQTVQVDGRWPGGYREVQTDGSGNYLAAYGDVPRGAEGNVHYATVIDYAQVVFHRYFRTADLVVTVDYSNEGVDGNYEPGHTGWVTVTNASGAEIKATVEVTTAAWPWWGGNSGFSTHHHEWQPDRPDITPGDWVYAALDNGYTTTVRVGTINAALNVDSDVVSGTLDVPWYSEGLQVRCEIHLSGAPSIEVGSINPDGSEVFICDYSGMWDILPGDPVVANYTEPDGDTVRFRPANPAPRMRVQKWLDGGNPGAGGNAVFYVQYRNEGDAPAANVVITDTLQGMTYLGDTSGFPHTGSGGQVVLDLGTVAPGEWIQFYVFAQVDAAAGERVTNTVQIATSDPYDQGDPSEKWSEWSGDVQPNDTRLTVDKGAWTGDPAAGYDVVFHVNACNKGGTGSAQVTLTDTLHVSMTLQTWWSDTPGWSEVSHSAQQLVVTKPVINGWRCEGVYVRAHVSAAAWPGLNLSNRAVIYTANDSPDNDNESWWWGNVNTPHTNLYINKQWAYGRLVPGGELHYNVHYRNTGNIPVGTFRITDTLPVNTTFRAAWRYGQIPFTPILIGNGYVVWEIAGLDNGYYGDFEVVLDVSPTAVPGALLVNTAELTRLPGEDSYDDNTSSWTETLFDHGPNLRVRKEGSWDNWGSDTRRASYNLNVENVGDVTVHNVTVTDIYPAGMRMDGGLGVNFWRWWDWRDNGDHFTATLELLEPGWSVGFNFGLITDTSPLPFGRIFTNTAEVMLVGNDANPDDNVDTAVLTTGPDLWVEKDLVAGELRPGELITFSLVFGNDRYGHEWWWNTQGNVWLTDTLPSGFEFITATRRSWGWAPYAPDYDDGTHVAWDTGGMPTGGEDELLVTLRIPATTTGLDTFTNHAEVASTEPVSDTEPYYANNSDSYAISIDLPYFTVSKVYASSRIAGMPITYTLTVTNTGNSAGTGVVLGDKFPIGFTYSDSDGVRVGNSVQWPFAALAAGGMDTGWFSGLLPCTTGAFINNDYAVIGSNEGVTSVVGAPVSFAVQAPALTADFGQSATAVVVGTPVQFTDASTTNGLAITGWAWDFGDSGTSTQRNPSHTFDSHGVFTVRLTVTDGCGFTDVATATVTVTPDCTPLTSVDFTYLPAKPLVNAPVTFTASYAPAGATSPITYTWVFGDGQTSTGNPASVQHTYTTAGAKTVRVTATNPCTPAGVQRERSVTIELRKVYLPLVMRTYP